MAATDQTRLIIELQTILRGLNQTLRGLDQIKRKLDSVAAVKVNVQGGATANRAALAAQRLSVQTQELANRQERARQATERLRLAQDRLTQSQQRAAKTSLGPQLDSHVRVFRNAEAATSAFNHRLASTGNALRSVGQGLASIGATLSVAVTAPLVAAGVASVDAAVRLDSLKRGLTAIVGSADEANRQLARLTQLARLPGIGFEEAIQGSIRLQAVGFSALEAERALKQFSNAIALTGGGRDELARVTVQLGQLAAKGKVLSQDLRPIIEAAPAVGRALLQAFGTVNADDIQELGLSSKQFLSILVDQLDELPRAAAGAKNSFENFRDEVFRAAAAVGETFLPALVRFAEVIGPAITKLAEAFSGLPQPVQLIVVGIVALGAALGPVLFVTGQLTLGLGRLLVGFGQLNVIGILPTIRNLRALVVGTLTAAEATRTLAAAQVLVQATGGAIITILAALSTALVVYNAFQKDAVTLSKERADQLTAEISSLEEQAKFLGGLQSGVERTADEQDRLAQIYDNLNRTAKIRVTGIKEEEQRLAALTEEITKQIAIREQERVQQAASAAAELANNLLRVKANEEERDAIAARIQANNELVQTLEREQVISAATTRALAERSITASTVEAAIGALKAESESLSQSQDELIASGEKLNDLTKEQVGIVRALERQTGLTARQLLVAAQSSGEFRADIAATIPILEAYIKKTDEATQATRGFRNAMSIADTDLRIAGEQADELAKRRRQQISDAASTAREAARSFADAQKFLDAFIKASPSLREAFQREAQIQGQSFDEFVRKSLESAFGRGAQDRAGTSLRNAQETLAKALADVALASSEEQVRIEKERNERLLRAAEVGQKLQLFSYREFLETRANLTAASIDEEIRLQKKVVIAAQGAQARLLAGAAAAGIPEAERVRRRAQAAKANEEAIKAEGKLKDLTAQREEIQVELRQQIALTQREQVNDIRELDIELADLQGRVEDAFNAETLERFREKLVDLSKAQQFLNGLLEDARRRNDADAVARLTREQRLNKEQIDAIRFIIQQKDALGALAAAEEQVRRAREKQQRLEEDLAFEVEFRGLSEEAAIARRLAGEEKLNASLTDAHETIRQIVADLQLRGVEPPQALLEFLDEIRGAVQGLGELQFSEQFRLVEQEFNRINDERLTKIADVERAVRERDIAEAEGLLLIRRINGEYTADLEAQLALLKQIAAQSKDANLIRQAQSAEETVKDANEELADFNRQLRSASIDALQEGLTDFFATLSDRTRTAKEKLLDLINSVSARIQQVIAENLAKEFIESLFGDGTEGTGVLASIGRLLGLGGGQGAVGGIGQTVGAGAQATQATAAATALTTGATAAATALTTAGVTTGTTLIASMTTAAASFSASIIAAGAAFAATVAAAGAASGVSQGLGGLGGAIGAAATGIFPAVAGGVVRIVEGGYPEAVLTTDPKHAARQVAILRAFLKETRGLGGRIRGLAAGGFTDRIDIAAPNVQVLNSGIGELAVAGAPSMMRIRQVLVDQRNLGDWVNSSEGEQVLVDFLYKHAPVVRKIGGK